MGKSGAIGGVFTWDWVNGRDWQRGGGAESPTLPTPLSSSTVTQSTCLCSTLTMYILFIQKFTQKVIIS